MNNILNESETIRNYIKQIIIETVREETKDCIRAYKAKIITAPNKNLCTVRLNGEKENLTIPYSSKMAYAKTGDIVWVAVLFGDFRNAIVWESKDFM